MSDHPPENEFPPSAPDERPAPTGSAIASRRSFDVLSALVVAVSMFCVLQISSARLPATWDEGDMAGRAENVWSWNRRVLLQLPIVRFFVPVPEHFFSEYCYSEPSASELPAAKPLSVVRKIDTPGGLCSKETISRHWKGTTTAEGHPQLPVLLASLGWTPSRPTTTIDLRFGPILFFSLATGAVFYRMRNEFGLPAACFAVLSILLIPRLFAHAQIAAWDSALTASWMLCWATCSVALRNRPGAALFGVCLGLTFSSKFSGWPVVLPFGIWLTLRIAFDRSFRNAMLPKIPILASISVAVSLLVFLVLNPPLWADPVDGFATFFRLNTRRDLNIAVLFLGKMYDLHHPLPWYNTACWIAVTVPFGLLLSCLLGLGKTLTDSAHRWPGLLILLNLLTLPVVRSFPGTPVHDGVRMFVAAFPFLALFSGIGAATLWSIADRSSRFQNAGHRVGQGVGYRIGAKVLVVAVYLSCVVNMVWYAPQWLSYYNILIGGLPGAAARGMEPTYYWDGFDGEVIDWLEKHTEQDETVGFSVGSSRSFQLDRNRQGYRFRPKPIPAKTQIDGLRQGGYRFYVLQRRPSAEFERDRFLLEQEKPVFVKTIRRGGWGPWKLDSVPIIDIFDLSAKVE